LALLEAAGEEYASGLREAADVRLVVEVADPTDETDREIKVSL